MTAAYAGELAAVLRYGNRAPRRRSRGSGNRLIG